MSSLPSDLALKQFSMFGLFCEPKVFFASNAQINFGFNWISRDGADRIAKDSGGKVFCNALGSSTSGTQKHDHYHNVFIQNIKLMP